MHGMSHLDKDSWLIDLKKELHSPDHDKEEIWGSLLLISLHRLRVYTLNPRLGDQIEDQLKEFAREHRKRKADEKPILDEASRVCSHQVTRLRDESWSSTSEERYWDGYSKQL